MKRYKYILCLLFCLPVCFQSYGQDTLRHYYDKQWKELPGREGAYYYRIAFLEKGLWFVNDYFSKNNQLQNAYTCLIIDSIKQGSYIKYYENGFKKEEGRYNANFKVGRWQSWFENGKKSAEEVFMDNPDLINEVLKKDSVLARNKTLAKYGYGGVRQGKCVWYHKNGQKSAEEIYKDGKIIKAQLWDEMGKTVKAKITDPYSNTQMPQFEENVSAFLSQNIVYPPDAKEAGIQGRQIVTFLIEEDGTLDNVEVARSIGSPSINAESIRVVRLMNGKFKPGMAHNRKEKFYYTLPISFKLLD